MPNCGTGTNLWGGRLWQTVQSGYSVDDNKEICAFLKAWIDKERTWSALASVHDGHAAVKKNRRT